SGKKGTYLIVFDCFALTTGLALVPSDCFPLTKRVPPPLLPWLHPGPVALPDRLMGTSKIFPPTRGCCRRTAHLDPESVKGEWGRLAAESVALPAASPTPANAKAIQRFRSTACRCARGAFQRSCPRRIIPGTRAAA